MQRRQLVTAVALAAAFGPVWAQPDFPTRQVRMLVPFPPGGPTDVMGRTAAKAIGEQLGQTFVVENKAGAGGNIGTDVVAKAAANGYTIGITAISSMAIAPHLYSNVPFDVEKDFQPISLVGTTPCAIMVNVKAPFSNLAELIAYAKAHPGEINYATSGVGTSNHLAAELLQSVAGIELTHVPYKGSSQIIPDLVSGEVSMSMESSLVTTLQHVKAGNLKALAVTSAERAKDLPDVPTVAELGYPGFEVETWFGLIAPAGTPEPVIQKLSEAWGRGAETAEVKATFDAIPGNLRSTTPQEFAGFIRAENKRWGDLISRLNIKLN